MSMNVLHQRLLQDVLAAGNALPFVIAGGYAVQAHGLVDRPSRDVDVATDASVPMETAVATLVIGLEERGWLVRTIGVDTYSARFIVTDPALSLECEVDILRETFYQPPVLTPYGPALSMDDAIGCKVRALADRGVARDLIDVRAASHWRSADELENLGRRLAREEFSLEDLAARLDGAKWFDDEEFIAYGLSEDDIADLRQWAQAWCEEIRHRLYVENFDFEEDDL
jgi:hypothetical protein